MPASHARYTARPLARGLRPPLHPPSRGTPPAWPRGRLSPPNGSVMSTGTDKRQREFVISFRVGGDEYEHIQTEADQAGVTVGTFARDVLVNARAPRRVRRPPAAKAELVRILGELGKIGSNVNQLAHKANIGQLRLLDPMVLLQLQDDLEELRDALMTALGRQP